MAVSIKSFKNRRYIFEEKFSDEKFETVFLVKDTQDNISKQELNNF
jgi:hypothetical protein